MQILNFHEKESPKAKDIKATPTNNLMEIHKVCSEMQKLCDENDGIGLSAVQVGIPWNLFVLKADSYSLFDPFDKYGYFINCTYEGLGEKTLSIEGCLSLKDESGNFVRYQVERFKDIRLTGQRLKVTTDLDLVDIDRNISIINQGVVFQHEIDHGNGILISDDGKEIF